MSNMAPVDYLDALTTGGPEEILLLVERLLEQDTPPQQVIVQVLSRIQTEVGLRWQTGEWSVADEHAATAASEAALGLIAGRIIVHNPKGHVVVACVAGERHVLPARMFAELLRSEGWRVTFLGADMPAEHLGRYLRSVRPLAVGLSATVLPSLTSVPVTVQHAHAAGVPVLAGGRAFGGGPRTGLALGVDAWCPDLSSAVGVLEAWAAEGAGSVPQV